RNPVSYPQKLRPGHRPDANTTGIAIFARTRYHAGQLQPQFASGNVEKIYLARVQGHPSDDPFACDAPIGSCTTQLGGRAIDDQGEPARTEFLVLHRFADGTSLVEAR